MRSEKISTFFLNNPVGSIEGGLKLVYDVKKWVIFSKMGVNVIYIEVEEVKRQDEGAIAASQNVEFTM